MGDIEFYSRDDMRIYKWKKSEEKSILKQAKSVRNKLNKLTRNIKYTQKSINLYNANMELLILAGIIRKHHEYERKMKKYKKAGVCEHFFENYYGKNYNSHFQDKTCRICGKMDYYLGDD